jgi:hypothetical protein
MDGVHVLDSSPTSAPRSADLQGSERDVMVHYDPSSLIAQAEQYLPSTILSSIASSGPSPTSPSYASTFPLLLRDQLHRTVRRSSSIQTVKGFCTTGLHKSFTYALEKVKKRWS